MIAAHDVRPFDKGERLYALAGDPARGVVIRTGEARIAYLTIPCSISQATDSQTASNDE